MQKTSNAYLLLKDDIEEGDKNRPQKIAKFVFYILPKTLFKQGLLL